MLNVASFAHTHTKMDCQFVTEINWTDFITERVHGKHDSYIPGPQGQKQEGQKMWADVSSNASLIWIQEV